MGSWFGCPWPAKAREWGTSTYYIEDTDQDEEVDPDELLYWVFEATPMGWTWALHFCQSAVKQSAIEVVGRDALVAAVDLSGYGQERPAASGEIEVPASFFAVAFFDSRRIRSCPLSL